MQASTVTCKNCGHLFTGKYCNACGEKVYSEHDKSFFHFIEEGVHFVTHFDGTFFTTLKYIFTRPGKLSEDYCYGIRKTLFKPLSLFFLLVVIYLIFPAFEGLNMQLYYHTHNNFYGSYAAKKGLALMQQKGWNDAQIAAIFHEKSAKVSKFLLLILLPLSALFFWSLTYKKRPYFFDQMVFATEVNSFYLIWGFMVLPLLLTVFEMAVHAISGSYIPLGDAVLGPVIYLGLLLYVVIAAKRFYNFRLWQSIGLGVAFYVAHYLIVQVIYKFLLFLITINLLH